MPSEGALRGVLTECFRLGLTSAEDHARAAHIPNLKETSPQRGRAMTQGELSALFAACDSTPAQGARDAALLAVLYGAGLRRAEAVALELPDYNAEDGALVVRTGKGRRARTVYVTNGAKEALTAWLDARGTEPGTIFHAVDKAGNLRPGGITPGAVYSILGRLQKDARVKPYSPHDARRSYITALRAVTPSLSCRNSQATPA
jgi:integrase/recombinase XerD